MSIGSGSADRIGKSPGEPATATTESASAKAGRATFSCAWKCFTESELLAWQQGSEFCERLQLPLVQQSLVGWSAKSRGTQSPPRKMRNMAMAIVEMILPPLIP